jgi:multidrug efflux system membrane fusion protein
VFASLDNQIDTQTGTVRAKARFSNAKLALFPSQFVNLQLNVRTIKDAVVVPVASLRHGDAGDYVFVLKDDRTVTQRPVTRGQATVDKVQIVSGLQIGERVVTEGADRLREGSSVVLPGDAPGAGTGARRGDGTGRRRAADAASAPAAAASAPGVAASGLAPEASAGQRMGAGGERRRRRDGEAAAAPQ